MALESRAGRLWSRLWLWPRVNLGAKMALITVMGVVALIALSAYLARAALTESIQHSMQDRVVVAETAAAHIDYALDGIEFDLIRASRQPDLVDPTRRNTAVQAAYDRLELYGSQVFIVDRTGQVIAAYPPLADRVSLAEANSVQSVLNGQTFAVARVARPVGMSASPIAVAPLRDASSNIVGALGVSVDLGGPRLRLFTNPVGLGGSGYMDLIDVNGNVLASTRRERVGKRSDHEQTLVAMIRAAQPVVSRCHDCHVPSAEPMPQPEVLAFAPLHRVPWGITVRQDEEEVMAAARDLQDRVFVLGAIELLGALLLVYLTTRSVIMPVQGLTTAARRIAAGDLETPIRESRMDEIGVLARAFDAMRSRLQDSIAEIQTWNRELDARVQERTAALAAARTEIQQSRDHLQAVIDGLSDQLLVIDLDHRVTRVNAAARRRAGDSAAVMGACCWDVAHDRSPCRPPDCECPFSRVIDTGKPFGVTHVHGDGARYLQVLASPLLNAEGRVYSIVELWRDVTEEAKMQETILQRNRELSAVNAIAREMGRSLKLDECLQLALAQVRRITRMDVGSVFLTQDVKRTLELHAFYGMSEQDAASAGRLALTDTACGGVLELGTTVAVQNTPRRLENGTLASMVHVPLIAKGTPLGALCLGTRAPRSFSEEEISLLSAIGSQMAMAVENARLYEELSRKEQMRGELLRRVITAQEDERKRIARELHDETSQTLSALRYTLDAAAKTCLSPETSPLIDQVRQLTVGAMEGVNKIIFDLRPTVLDHLGLVAALRWYAHAHLDACGARVEITELGASQRLPPAAETALFRTAQEAINNVARHSGARHLWVVFEAQAEQVELWVKDDGIGFDAGAVASSSDLRCGLGLLGMEERMREVGGEFFISSIPSEGTTVELRVPITGGESEFDPSTDRG